MAFRRKSTCVESIEKNLLELKRRAQLESLRYHLNAYSCFPPTKDPLTSPITIEEIKKLARAWKLHERRNNFWKIYVTRDEIVDEILEYAIDNKIDLTLVLEPDKKHNQNSATAPESPKPSTYIRSMGSVSYSSPLVARIKSRREPAVSKYNFSGLKKDYFSKKDPVQMNEDILALMARYTNIDKKSKVVKLSKVIDNWRENNFFMEDLFGKDMNPVSNEKDLSVQALKFLKSRKSKQRTLAMHLANYSFNNPQEFSNLSKKDVEIFVSIADCDDPLTISTTAIALSNICRNTHVRELLLELNAIHKILAMVPNFQSQNILQAAALLFFYISFEREVEDRIFGGFFLILQNNCSSANPETRLLALHTLNNLLPCIERHRVCDLALGTIQTNKMILEDDHIFTEVLNMILNMSIFTNLHILMLDCDVMEPIAQAASRAAARSDIKSGQALIKIMSNFLHSQDIASTLVENDFIPILVDILGISDQLILKYGFRILASISLIPQFNLTVLESDVLTVITGLVFNERLSQDVAIDAARFFTNISLVDNRASAKRLMGDGIPSALVKLISNEFENNVRTLAVKGLQNLFVHKDVAIKFVDTSKEPLFSVLLSTGEVSAAKCIYNLTRFENCQSKLVQKETHLALLDVLCKLPQPKSKSACLQALALFSGNDTCINDLLNASVIPKLYEQIALTDHSTWLDISHMLLSIVAKNNKLSDTDRNGIEKILASICNKKLTSDPVLVQSIRIISFLSINLSDFSKLDPVLKNILNISDSEEIAEGAAIILYNLSCNQDCISVLLNDVTYLNVMIRMMRSGKAEVQVTIAETLRTMCSYPACIALLTKGHIMADFIAIALLRTSSVNVKQICGESFYNIFCHESTRLQLLRGDLWWSIMRLARTEVESIRKTCADGLYQLASEATLYGEVLRNLHIFSFIKDVIIDVDDNMRSSYIISIEYILNEFKDAVSSLEILALLEIAMDCLMHSNSEIIILGSIRILLKCASSCQLGSELDFIKHDTIKSLDKSIDVWSINSEALLNVTATLQFLTKFEAYCKAVSLHDLHTLLNTIYQNCRDTNCLENLAYIFLNYVSNKIISSDELCENEIWRKLLKVALYVKSKESSSPTLRSIMISILSYYFDSAILIRSLMVKDFFVGLLSEPVTQRSPAVHNIFHIISSCSLSSEISETLIESGLCDFFWTVLQKNVEIVTNFSDKYFNHEFIASILKNVNMHVNVVSKFVKSPNSKSLLELLSTVNNKNIQLDLCSVLNHTLDVSMDDPDPEPACGDSSILTPGALCNLCKVIGDTTYDKAIVHMTRYIMGMTLDKYNVEMGCDPNEVSSMYLEMNDRENVTIPNQLANIQSKVIDSIPPLLIENKSYPTPPVILYKKSDKKNATWIPIVKGEYKRLENVANSLNNPEPQKYTDLESVEPFALSSYYKTFIEYPLVKLQTSDVLDEALYEEDEEEDEKKNEGNDDDDHFDGDFDKKLKIDSNESNNPQKDSKFTLCQICGDLYASIKCFGCDSSRSFYCKVCVARHNSNKDYSSHKIRLYDYNTVDPKDLYDDESASVYDLTSSIASHFTVDEIDLFIFHFALIDTDKGGTIDAKELVTLVENLGGNLNMDHAVALIKDFDGDGSGSIDFEEFVKLMLNIKQGKGAIEDNAFVAAIYQNQVKIVKARNSMIS